MSSAHRMGVTCSRWPVPDDIPLGVLDLVFYSGFFRSFCALQRCVFVFLYHVAHDTTDEACAVAGSSQGAARDGFV